MTTLVWMFVQRERPRVTVTTVPMTKQRPHLPTPSQSTHALLQLQRQAGNAAVTELIDPKNTLGSEPRAADEIPPAGVPLGSSLVIRIIAHSSPRWASAPNVKAADHLNLELSRKRAQVVRSVVETVLGDRLPGVPIEYNVTFPEEPEIGETVSVGSEARGSREALKATRGDRRANDQSYRRVDVFVQFASRTRHYAGQSLLPSTLRRIRRATLWGVNVMTQGTGSLVATVSTVQLRITNMETNRSAIASFGAFGVGTVGVSASVPLSDEPTLFVTDGPVGFSDFDGALVRLTSLGVGLIVIGWEKALLTFVEMGSGAESIDVGGLNIGAQLKLGGASVAGLIKFDGVKPSDVYDEPGPTHGEVPFDVRDQATDGMVVYFATGESALDDQAAQLEEFATHVADRHAGNDSKPEGAGG